MSNNIETAELGDAYTLREALGDHWEPKLNQHGDLEVQVINSITQQSLRHEVHNFTSYRSINDGTREHVGVTVDPGKIQVILGFTIAGVGLSFVDIFSGATTSWESIDEPFVTSNHTLDDPDATMSVNWVNATENTHYDLSDDDAKFAKFAGIGIQGGTFSSDEPGPLEFEIEEPATIPADVSGEIFLVVIRNESGEDLPFNVMARILEIEPEEGGEV